MAKTTHLVAMPYECRECGKTFASKRPGRATCGMCSARRNAKPTPCEQCGEIFGAHRIIGMRFCSNRCSAQATSARRNAGKVKAKRVRPRRPPSSRIHVIDCALCLRSFVARHSNAVRCTPCRNVHITNKLMGLYRTACQLADVRAACMWRHKLVDYLRDRDGDRCAICSKRINFAVTTGPRGESDQGPSIDHVVPVSHGGSDELANLRLTHWSCNRARGNRGGNEQLHLIG